MINNIVKIKKYFVILGILIMIFSTQALAAEEAKESPQLYITNTRVNFREGPSLDAARIKTLNRGTEVVLAEYGEEWSKVLLGEQEGYINNEFIVEKDNYSGDIEYLEWSQAKNIIRLYTPIEVTDARTGVVYYIQSFSNGRHADVETLTKEDTDKLLSTYGGRWQWDPRPVRVNIDGRIIAASINGMPHGGGTISGNGMNGQVCLHFKGSSTHNGNAAFTRDHQNAALEAYNLGK